MVSIPLLVLLLAAGSASAQDFPGPVHAPPADSLAAEIAAAARADTSGHAVTDSAARALGPVDYLWVVRTSLTRREDVDRMLERARDMKVAGLLVQVVGRGDAYYDSDLLPAAEALTPLPGESEFDPLGHLLPRAHDLGLEVHAWINACLVWSAPRQPRSTLHVLRRHPEWVAALRNGRRLSQLSTRERGRLGLEGVYLAPGHPGVREWVAAIAGEVAGRYAVDGIHLDYIRQPSVEVGFDPTTRARFGLETGVDPSRRGHLPASQRASVDSAWREFQSRQVTAIVRAVRESLEAVRPGLHLSAAVVADTLAAERLHAQPWRSWVREGLLDRAFVMSYAPPTQIVLDQLLGFAEERGVASRVVPGIAVYNAPASTVAAKMKGARALGFHALALYSYDSLFARPSYWETLSNLLGPVAPLHP